MEGYLQGTLRKELDSALFVERFKAAALERSCWLILPVLGIDLLFIYLFVHLFIYLFIYFSIFIKINLMEKNNYQLTITLYKLN